MNQICPLYQEPCKEHSCKWFIQILGRHPQTGEMLNKHDCAISWLPILLIENAQQTRQAGAAIESFRNEVAGQQVRQELSTPLLTDAVDPAALPFKGGRVS